MSILPETKYTSVFAGSAIRAQYIQGELREKGINSILANDGESATRAGFGSSYDLATRLLVKKDDVLQANHLIESIISSDEEIPDRKQIEPKATHTETYDPSKPKRSNANLLINVALILFSLFRLSPLLRGEELPTWRIAISGTIIVICTAAIYFSLKDKD